MKPSRYPVIFAALVALALTGCKVQAQTPSGVPLTVALTASAAPPYAVGQLVHYTLTATSTSPASTPSAPTTAPATVAGTTNGTAGTVAAPITWWVADAVNNDTTVATISATIPAGVTISNLSAGLTQSGGVLTDALGTVPAKGAVAKTFDATFSISVP
jgi:hypothetical protein